MSELHEPGDAGPTFNEAPIQALLAFAKSRGLRGLDLEDGHAFARLARDTRIDLDWDTLHGKWNLSVVFELPPEKMPQDAEGLALRLTEALTAVARHLAAEPATPPA